MMNIKRTPFFFLLLLAFSCEQVEIQEVYPEENASVFLAIDTKGLTSGNRITTYRVVLSEAGDVCQGVGSYCDSTLKHEPMGSWLAPCSVSTSGDPLKKDGSIASNPSEVYVDGKYGLRFNTTTTQKYYYLSVASPAIGLKTQNNKSYFTWNANEPLFLSEKAYLSFYGSWAEGEYVYKSSQNDAITLKEQRARLSVHIECGELEQADIQAVTLNHITQTRWYIYSGISTNESHYSKSLESLYSYSTDGGIIHLDKNSTTEEEREWNSPSSYILPFDYSLETSTSMQPELEVLLGTDTGKPGKALVKLSAVIEPMKNYVYNLFVSKQYIHCTLTAEDWYNGGTIETIDEQWAKIDFEGNNQWDKLDDDINSDESWNDQL